MEADREGEHPLRLAATAGLHFLHLLDQEGVRSYAPRYVERYPLMMDAEPDPGAARHRSVLAGRAPDGIALYQELVSRSREGSRPRRRRVG